MNYYLVYGTYDGQEFGQIFEAEDPLKAEEKALHYYRDYKVVIKDMTLIQKKE